ncbi:ABC transporter permease [Micromonospora carbonacea]|uniref:Peptide/nickel transport system permease protein n=1 Tax=Micromonospora carbonacea TaxID=47853 RepID=A0A1C4V8Y1_9ACTN|nr:ABC transporter permease [Micromonospora carbonacea]SCE80219.1 peptide/nickel transport system permease protein [Micromonospora carbonacea]
MKTALDDNPVVAPRGLLPRRLKERGPRSGTARLVVGVGLAVVLVGGTVGALLFGHITPVPDNVRERLLGLGQHGHLLGTDELGRDMLRWTIAGFGWTAAVSAVGACVTAAVAIVLGMVAGATKGVVQAGCTRAIDICLSLPYLVIAVAVMAAVGRGFWPLSITLGLVSWPIFARVVYAETRGLMQRDYVRAARLLGVSPVRIQLTHLLPGLRHTIMVMWAFVFADLLVAESGLSFLGIGAPLGSPSLGNMLAAGRQYLVDAPRMVFVPAVVIVLAVTAANLIGDGVAARMRHRMRMVRR